MARDVEFRKATRRDDGELRRILREYPSGGDVSLRIEKEPGYFDASEVEGENDRVLVALDAETMRIVGVGAFYEKLSFVNGEPEWVGYLSNLRIEPAYRGGRVLVAGYKEAKKLYLEQQSELYITTIMDDNVIAKQALTSGRPGLPTYCDLGVLNTLILGVRRNPWAEAPDGVAVRPATDEDAAGIVEFWKAEGQRRQFFPAYTAEHLQSASGLLRGLAIGELCIAEDAGGICGTAAVWDQTPFRQWVIDSYSRRAGLLRYPYNLYARATGRPSFPAAGTALDYRFLGLVCVRGDRVESLEGLCRSLWAGLVRQSPGALVIAGFHRRDPLGQPFLARPNTLFRSRIYLVHWPEGESHFAALDDRIPYLEVGSL